MNLLDWFRSLLSCRHNWVETGYRLTRVGTAQPEKTWINYRCSRCGQQQVKVEGP